MRLNFRSVTAQLPRMVAQMILHKRLDKVIAVVIIRMLAQL